MIHVFVHDDVKSHTFFSFLIQMFKGDKVRFQWFYKLKITSEHTVVTLLVLFTH